IAHGTDGARLRETAPDSELGSGAPAGTLIACLKAMRSVRAPWLLAAILALAPSAHALCPNGIVEPPETCDDGNLVPGDGCSPLCLLEVPNLPPVCTDAFASPASLWPPNHKFVPISIDGVTDPDGDPVAITVVDVAQDEPVDASDNGGTCGDAAGVGTGDVAVRSERSGGGDGRVYHVAVPAEGPPGALCTGQAAGCVPARNSPRARGARHRPRRGVRRPGPALRLRSRRVRVTRRWRRRLRRPRSLRSAAVRHRESL